MEVLYEIRGENLIVFLPEELRPSQFKNDNGTVRLVYIS